MGRPLKYDDPEVLERKINEYFKICDQGREVQHITKRGDVMQINKPIPYTFEGLAVYLDVDAETIRNYGKSNLFFGTISRARDKIHQNWIELSGTNDLNPKIAQLVLSASCKDYKQNQDNTLTVMTIEDRLRQINSGETMALPDPDTEDAVVVESGRRGPGGDDN